MKHNQYETSGQRKLFFPQMRHLFIAFTFVFFTLFVGCSLFENGEVDIGDYTVKHSHIRTLGDGSKIYWLDNQTILMRAKIYREDKTLDIGIFEISMDGRHKKLVDLMVERSIQYCVDSDMLYVSGPSEGARIASRSDHLTVRISDEVEKLAGFVKSPFLCDAVPAITKDLTNVQYLKKEDGYLYSSPKAGTLKESDIYSKSSSQSQGKSVLRWTYDWLRLVGQRQPVWDLKVIDRENREIEVGGNGHMPLRLSYFSEYENAYFGFKHTNTDCMKAFWLYRGDWEARFLDVCVDNSSSGGSKILTPTQPGIIFKRYSAGRNTGLYLVKNGDADFLANDTYKNESVSPDGCLVALTVGDIEYFPGKDTSVQQELHIIDICAYVLDKEKLNDSF